MVSVFRVPLMAVVTQIVCLLMKYGTLQAGGLASLKVTCEQSKLPEHYLRLNAGLWDWFRWTVAFKMSAESLSTVFSQSRTVQVSRATDFCNYCDGGIDRCCRHTLLSLSVA